MDPRRLILAPALGVAMIAASAGCGGAAPPTRAQTDALAAVRAAEAVGAQQTPQAAYHLELAREELRQAESLIGNGKMDEASGALVRAKADADLATALSHEARTRERAEEVRRRIEALERQHQ